MEKPKPQRHALGGRDPERLAPQSFAGRVHRLRRLLIPRFDEPCAEESYRRFAGRESAAAWSKCSLSSAPARLLRLLWAARYSQEEAGPLGAQPPPRVLEPAASKAADFTAPDRPGGAGATRPRGVR